MQPNNSNNSQLLPIIANNWGVGGDELEAVELRRRLEGCEPEARVGVERRDVAKGEVDLELPLTWDSQAGPVRVYLIAQLPEGRRVKASYAKGLTRPWAVHRFSRHLQQASVCEELFFCDSAKMRMK